ncbi:MAG TPA: ABC transporter substrate-binding protein [Stellaceae bacterium]|nr:ABC transporter substrate-binding protein [Stellaceae bacterium]
MKTTLLALVLGAALLLVPPLAAPSRAADGFDIHVIDDLTGGAAFLGKEEQQALLILEKLVNQQGGIGGKPLHFVFHDDQSNPQIAVQLTNDVLALHPAVIMGSGFVATCNAMAPLMQNGPVMYCFSPGIHPPSGSYVFVAGVSTFDQSAALVNYFRLKGWTKLALVTSTDATGQDADEGFAKLLKRPENGTINIVSHQHFNPTDVTISAQIERIKSADPQVLIGWATGAPSATIFRGAVQAGLTLPMGTTGGNMTYAQMKNFAAFLPHELYLPAPLWPVGADPQPKLQLDPAVAAKQKDFYASFKDAGAKPDEGSTLAWDPATLVIDALRKLGTGASAAQLREYLLHLKGAAGVNGVYDFEKYPQRGLSIENTIVTRWNAAAARWDVVAKPTGVPLAP